MAAKKKDGINIALLSSLSASTASGGFQYMNKAEAESVGLLYNPPLVVVNAQMVDPQDANKIATKTTEAAAAYLANQASPAASTEQSSFAIITNAVLPESKKRGGGSGAPVKYPFDSLEIGQTFFVPVTAKQPNPVKSLGSAVSAAIHRNSTKIGERQAEVTKRGPGNKTVLDADGNKVKETKMVPVYKRNRNFTIRAVEAGKSYGGWTAPSNGALIGRVAVSE